MAELQRESTVFLLSPRRCPEPLEVRDRAGAEYRCQRFRFRRFQAVAHETIAQAQADEYVVRGGFRPGKIGVPSTWARPLFFTVRINPFG